MTRNPTLSLPMVRNALRIRFYRYCKSRVCDKYIHFSYEIYVRKGSRETKTEQFTNRNVFTLPASLLRFIERLCPAVPRRWSNYKIFPVSNYIKGRVRLVNESPPWAIWYATFRAVNCAKTGKSSVHC